MLRRNSALRELSLADSEPRPADALALADALQFNTTLQFLRIHDAPLPVQALRGGSGEREVDLSGSRLRCTDCVFIGRLLRLNGSLTHIDLSNNSICSAGDLSGLRAMAEALQANDQILRVDLAGNGLGPSADDLLATIRTAIKFNNLQCVWEVARLPLSPPHPRPPCAQRPRWAARERSGSGGRCCGWIQ